MNTLFSFVGTVKDICMYPKDDSSQQTSKVCYVKFSDPRNVDVAQHLTNTVFIDRALVVTAFAEGKIPDESTAMSLANSGLSGGSNSGVVSQVVTTGQSQVITTIDPRLTALGLPQYPPLPANMDPSKIEEIRRTVYIGNVDSSISAEQLLKFFNQIGEVKYVRMAGDEVQPSRFAFVEFTEQSSVANALQYNGVVLGGRPLKINHSNNAIVKPQTKSTEAAQKEIEEAMKRILMKQKPGAFLVRDQDLGLKREVVQDLDVVLVPLAEDQLREKEEKENHVDEEVEVGIAIGVVKDEVDRIQELEIEKLMIPREKEISEEQGRNQKALKDIIPESLHLRHEEGGLGVEDDDLVRDPILEAIAIRKEKIKIEAEAVKDIEKRGENVEIEMKVLRGKNLESFGTTMKKKKVMILMMTMRKGVLK
ncbi:serine/arginine-rich splicing factor 11-like protein [Dinothrombium tinctorium]|uniref:Serine/arginine-rich splicing factor 11-like protein n=1 Tax=Dinothrombium tinctorium TaxID=1965070 RepID=A0A3S3NYY5_9ACAR|nr:serine/arginine-rich splicing factor 11-like protein [Dinothrombium tinctorium]